MSASVFLPIGFRSISSTTGDGECAEIFDKVFRRIGECMSLSVKQNELAATRQPYSRSPVVEKALADALSKERREVTAENTTSENRLCYFMEAAIFRIAAGI